MQRIKCYDCGKDYNYDKDDFCPYCGAFNQPPRTLQVTADGTVVRVDGLNEANHAGSFVHEEMHREEKARKRLGLEHKEPRAAQRAPAQKAPAQKAPAQKPPAPPAPDRAPKKAARRGVPTVVWIFIAVIFFNLLLNFLRIVL